MFKLTLDGNATDAYEWISVSRIIMKQINCLNIGSDIFTQYFFLWRGLCQEFKTQMMAITNSSKPLLPDIVKHSFESNNRFMDVQKRKNVNTKSITMATVVEPGTIQPVSVRGCTLCTYDKSPAENNHKLSQCTVYKDYNSKITKLKEVKGCTSCGYTNHYYRNCKFKYSRPCSTCKGWHLYYLCYKQNTENYNFNDKKEKKIKSEHTSNSVATYTTETEQYNDVILPTASVIIKTLEGDSPVRLFKDLGSQTTFVRSDVAKLINHEIVRETNIQISGINSSKSYKTKVIKFPIDVKGQGSRIITAVCLDTINTQFETPGLKNLIVKLKDKGFSIADDMINSDKISDVSILLGSDNSHLLPINQTNFKADVNDVASCIYETPSGLLSFIEDSFFNITCVILKLFLYRKMLKLND